jgi:hypothetical protein
MGVFREVFEAVESGLVTGDFVILSTDGEFRNSSGSKSGW